MEITLEKIELVKDRTGVTYKEAKEALEAAEGNVVEAIISIEETVDEVSAKKVSEKVGAQGEALISKMKEIVKKGNVSKIQVSRDGETVVNIPLTVGVLGGVVAPFGMIAGIVAALGFKCKIEFIKDDGSVIDLSEKAGDFYEEAKEKGSGIYSDIKEKAPGAINDLKEKGGEALAKAKDVANSAKEKIQRDRDDAEDDVDVEFVNLCEKECESCEEPCEEPCDDCGFEPEAVVEEAAEAVEAEAAPQDEQNE